MKNNPLVPSFITACEEKDALSPEEALEIFDMLAARTDLALGYPAQGCHARAHIMCRDLAEMGLSPKKAWALDTLYERLYLKPPNSELLVWEWHIAPALPVQMKDGKIEDLVFDPVFFDGPVSLSEWGKLIHAKPENSQIVPPGVIPDGCKSDYVPNDKGPLYQLGTRDYYNADEHAKREIERYSSLQKASPRVVFQSQFRQQLCQMRPDLPLQGATWVSVTVPVEQRAGIKGPKNTSI